MNAKHLKWLLPLLLLAAFHQEVSAQTGTIHCDTVRFTWKAHNIGVGNGFSFFGTQGKKFIIDWGDSRQETVTKDSCRSAFPHTYYYDTTYHVMLYGVDADARILSLSLDDENLTSLDVSGCTSLTSLDCDNNQLTSLDVSENTALTYLSCYSNQLSSLDVSGCTSLTSLSCSSNQLSSLDVSGCTALTYLNCHSNQLSSLDVSGCTALTYLNCHGNLLSSLDVSGCTSLTSLRRMGYADTLRIQGESMSTLTIEVTGIYDYIIGVLDASGCTSLRKLTLNSSISGTVNSLKLQGCTALDTVSCSNNELASLDVSGCTALTSLDCDNNQLTSLDVSGCTALTSLNCHSNQLSSLDVSGCTALTNLSCYSNQLGSLDVSGCTALTSLYCRWNQLSSLDVSGCTSLTSLNCGSHLLNNLDVSSCTSLVSLNCNNVNTANEGKGNLRSLDVSKNTLLKSLDCAGNQLRSIDISKNTLLSILNCGYNRIPFSVLYKAYNKNSNWEDFEAYGQSDSTTILINRPFDLSSERIVGQTLTTFELTDAYGRDMASDFWTENKFVFQFHEPLNYKLRLNNKVVGSFTWYISVVEDMPVQYFTVQVSSNNTEWGTATITGNGTYEEGMEVTVTAKANTGYRFVNWTRKDGSVFSTEAVHTFTVLENAELTANFEKLPEDVETFTVAVAANDAEWGRVSQTGDGRYEKDEEITVTAKANAGYRFVDWTKKDGSVFSTEAVHTFAVTENMELTANFEKLPETETFTVSLSSNNPSWGIVSLIGNGICERGEAITIIATPMMGCRFINWTRKDGSVFSTEAVHTFAVTENLELTANFKQTVGNRDYTASDLRIYPNPNNGTFYIELPEPARIEILSSVGRLLQREQVPAGTFSINLQSGVYYMRVAMQGGVVVKKVVVL